MNERHLILIVEDDPTIAGMIEDHLTASGFRTELAADGRAAVERVRKSPPDLIVMDLMMPRLTGGEAAKELRLDPLTSHIPIVAISAVADVTSIADFLPLDEVLPKPFDLDELRRAIQRHLPALGNDAGMSASHPAV